jgi:ABC-type antimicrobial peptide transport system permease subunit
MEGDGDSEGEGSSDGEGSALVPGTDVLLSSSGIVDVTSDALGLALAAVGIFSVRSYVVGQRVGEIGIRMALGATPGRVLQVFLAEGAWIVGLGIACGAALSLALTRTMASLLFAVQANDPLIFLGCALLMAAIGIAASLLPARSAAKVDPIKALSR